MVVDIKEGGVDGCIPLKIRPPPEKKSEYFLLLSFDLFFFLDKSFTLPLKHRKFACLYKKLEDPYGCNSKIKTALEFSSISCSVGLLAINLTWGLV